MPPRKKRCATCGELFNDDELEYNQYTAELQCEVCLEEDYADMEGC